MNDKRDEKAGNLQNGSAPPACLFVRGRAELTWFYGFNLSAARLQFAFSKLASRYWGVDGRGKWQVNARVGFTRPLQFALANWLVGTGERAHSIRFETRRPFGVIA